MCGMGSGHMGFTSLSEAQILPHERTGTCLAVWSVCGDMLRLFQA